MEQDNNNAQNVMGENVNSVADNSSATNSGNIGGANANGTTAENTTNPTRKSKKKSKKRNPLSFGGTMMASMLGMILGIVVINILALICFIVGVLSLSFFHDKKPVVDGSFFVRINLDRPIYEQQDDEMVEIFSNDRSQSLYDLLRAIEAAKKDNRVKGIYLDASTLAGSALSYEQSSELRQALVDFSSTGKPVIAYGNSYTQPAYFLVSAASCVAVNPAGLVDFKGLAAESIFIKDMLNKLKINVELVRPNSNSFKSAGEMFTLDKFSQSNKEQVRCYLNQMWDNMVEAIGTSRNLTADAINNVADNLEGMLPKESLSAGLIDTLMYEKDVMEMLKQKGSSKIIDATRYVESLAPATVTDCIALVVAEGDVNEGTNRDYRRGIYSKDFIKALDEAVKDNSVKAIVLRINSPGGSSLASAQITDAVRRANEKKPVIVSMGAVAASAGYEMACHATTIVANPITLTGSIGVFGIVPEFGTMMREKLGITTDTVLTRANASGMSPMRPLSSVARAMLQRNVEDFYVEFCMQVAQGRNLEVEYVDSIGRGRVWTGADAVRLHLADTLGGLQTALSIAAQKSKLSNYKVKTNYGRKDVMSQFFTYLRDNDEIQLHATMQRLMPFYRDMLYWSEMDHLQSRLPFSIEIQ